MRVRSTTVIGLLLTLNQSGCADVKAEPVQDLVRARQIELVDASGQVRAQLKVEDSGETVLRLKDADGTIRVKLGASPDGSGLLLANHVTEPGAHIVAGTDGTTLRLRNADGKELVFAPR